MAYTFGDVFEYCEKEIDGVTTDKHVFIKKNSKVVFCTPEKHFKDFFNGRLNGKKDSVVKLTVRMINIRDFKKWYPVCIGNLVGN